MKESNSTEISRLEKVLTSYQDNKLLTKTTRPHIFDILDDNIKIESLTKDIVKKLIEVIYVYFDKRIDIVFRYKDELEDLMSLKQNYDYISEEAAYIEEWVLM